MNWMPISEFESQYSISDTGAVMNTKRSKLLKWFRNEYGYVYVILYKANKQKAFRVSRLVANHFIPNPLNLPEVNHKFGDKEDNRAISLEWSTVSANRKHAWDTGLNKGNTRKVA